MATHERDRHKTAFTTPLGLFEYVRMPFGVCNGQATFQRLLQATMSDLVSQILVVYLDDIMVYSESTFLQQSVKVLGHHVSARGVGTDPSKISAVKEWTVVYSVKELRSFLGSSTRDSFRISHSLLGRCMA